MEKLKHIFADARHFQLLYLGSFLIATFLMLERDDLFKCLTIFTVAIATQCIGVYYTTKNYTSIKSACITALGLCLLLKTNTYETAIIASVLAIGSKFIIRSKGKHIFNPVNFGIIITILFTQDAWISPGQWGSEMIILFIIGALGFLVLTKANRLDIALTFLLTFGGMLFVKNIVYLQWPTDFFFHQISNGTLMLFTFFMITDPMTTPNHKKGRILFAIVLAIISFFASTQLYFYSAPIYVLFGMSFITPFIDRIWKAKKYQWNLNKEDRTNDNKPSILKIKPINP